MKRIIALIKPNMLDDVIFALHRIDDFPGASISDVRGIGRGLHIHVDGDRKLKPVFGLPTFVRIEIICPTEQSEEIVSTIAREAHTGLEDDGKIVICPVDNTVCISTGERK